MISFYGLNVLPGLHSIIVVDIGASLEQSPMRRAEIDEIELGGSSQILNDRLQSPFQILQWRSASLCHRERSIDQKDILHVPRSIARYIFGDIRIKGHLGFNYVHTWQKCKEFYH